MTWQHWLKGLVAAAVSGVANSITNVMVAPETFNFQSGLRKLGESAAVAGILGAALYLKQSPVPKDDFGNNITK